MRSTLTAFLVVPVITRLLTPASYGRAAAALVVFMLLSIVGGAGLPDAAARVFFAGHGLAGGQKADARGGRGRLWAVAGHGPHRTARAPLVGRSYGAVFQLAVWGGALAAVSFASQMVLRAEERVWAFLGVTLVGTIGGQAAGLALTVVSHSATGYIAGVVAGTAVAAGAGLVLTSAMRAGMPATARGAQGSALGLPIVPHGLAVYMLASADRIVIAAVLGLAATGRYQVAYAVGGLGVAVVTALNQAWLPVVLGAPAQSRWEVLTATSRVVNVIAAMIASGLALLAPLGLLIAAPAPLWMGGAGSGCGHRCVQRGAVRDELDLLPDRFRARPDRSDGAGRTGGRGGQHRVEPSTAAADRL